MLFLVMALVVLTLSPLAGEIGAAQDATDSDQACEEGFVLDETTGECVEENPVEEPLECDPGFVLDEATGECVEESPVEEPQECDAGFVLDEATGECVEEDAPPECEEGFVLDEATGECVEDPNAALIPAADEPRQFAINKFFCPAGYAVTNRDPGQMITDCHEPPVSVEFTVSDGGGGYSSTQQTSVGDTSGGAIFTDVPAGNSINVTETIPEGYGAPIVFCHGENTEGTIVQPVEDMLVENGRVYVDNREVFLTLCTWFNMSTLEPAANGTGTVYVNKHACPAGYDASAHDMYDMAATCHEDAGVVNFSVFEYGGGGYDGGIKPTSGGPGPNLVTFTDVPNVKLTIYEEVVPSYTDAVVFCGVEDQLGNDVSPTAYHPWEGGFNTVPVEAPGEGNVVFCDWYNLADAGSGTIYVNKHACPVGYDWSARDMYDMAANCHEDAGPVPFTLSNTAGGSLIEEATTSGFPNSVTFTGVPPVDFTVTETIPTGYYEPIVFCKIDLENGDDVEPTAEIPVVGGNAINWTMQADWVIFCDWYNIPGDGSTVTIYKWICPEGVPYDQDQGYYETNCTQYSDDFSFALTDANGTSPKQPSTGQVQWTDVHSGPIEIQESIPYEWGQPVVFCGFTAMVDGAVVDAPYAKVDATNGYYETSIEYAGTDFFCQWFNIPGDPGEITIYKWTCPEGYDLYAYGASPLDDCKDATNGVTFYLDPPDPAATDLQTDTGDSIDGAVYFGGLNPGTYVVTEEVPADTEYVFVLDCTGTRDDKVHPYPLSFGDTLPVYVYGGDKIVCHWFNVPTYDDGKVTVIKYTCSTKTFTSDVDCQIYEDGATFDLLAGGTVVDTKTTDGVGKITWVNVEPGDYWLKEHDRTWCNIASEQLAGDKKSFAVEQNTETIVKVYNCNGKPGGKQPTKYPNTGVGPVNDGGGSGPGELPSAAPLLGLGLVFIRRLRSLRSGATRMTRRVRIRHLGAVAFALPLIALVAFGPAMAQTDTPGPAGTPGTPEAQLCLPVGTPTADATPDSDAQLRAGMTHAQGEGTPSADEDCPRGAVPTHIVIEAANVDADIEILETVAGVMEAPSGATDVAWYKETARLGEPGNIVMAGHLNYWGVPEGVFFSLGTLREGDTIEVTGDDGEVATYTVQWVRQEDSTKPPSEDVLGPTGAESLTLITCGGEWDASIAEYNERTVARAIRDTGAVATPGT